MYKVKIEKDIHLQMWRNLIKTNLQTCNLWTGQYVSYKSVNLFWLNLPHQNGKTFSTSNFKNFSPLQIHIFCYFDFCHCKRNTLWFQLHFLWSFSLVYLLSSNWFEIECMRDSWGGHQTYKQCHQVPLPILELHFGLLKIWKLLVFCLFQLSISFIETKNYQDFCSGSY